MSAAGAVSVAIAIAEVVRHVVEVAPAIVDGVERTSRRVRGVTGSSPRYPHLARFYDLDASVVSGRTSYEWVVVCPDHPTDVPKSLPCALCAHLHALEARSFSVKKVDPRVERD